MVYFASGRLSLPGAMFTASHNPPEYNGLKLCLFGAWLVGVESGLGEVRVLAERESSPGAGAVSIRGLVIPREMRDDYIEHLFFFVDLGQFLPFTVVVDAANGMA